MPIDGWPHDQALILEGVHARRGGVEILQGIDLSFPAGTRTTIIGPSGSGKSTLLRLLNRLADPSAGRLLVGETPLESFPVTLLRRHVGLVFQAPRPLPGTVADCLSYPNAIRGQAPPEGLAAMLEEVGLDPSWLDREAEGLSGGERQRLALAVALGVGPSVLALDEPTSALDPSAAMKVAEVLRRRSVRDGMTVVAVTHNRDQCRWLGDVTVVLESGRIVDRGPTSDVLARAEHLDWEDAR